MGKAINRKKKRRLNAREKQTQLNTLLSGAAIQGNIRKIKALISRGADPNALSGRDQMPPLSLAAMYGQEEAAELLIEKGADINYRDEDNCSALLLALINGHVTLSFRLVELGAEIYSDGGNLTPRAWINANHPGLVDSFRQCERTYHTNQSLKHTRRVRDAYRKKRNNNPAPRP